MSRLRRRGEARIDAINRQQYLALLRRPGAPQGVLRGRERPAKMASVTIFRLCALALAAIVLLAGCASGGAPSGDPPGLYAGYSEGEAISSTTSILRSQLAEPGSPLFQKELEVGEVEQGTMVDGSTRAWVAHLLDFDGNPTSWCVLVRTSGLNAANRPIIYDVQLCDDVTP
jgi:hypothetical protein